ncbi:flagellar hook protein FlgE [Desulfolithobacter dissulfuricans]|uniref:Flagellar hook protein FlgE n=1 Tax=Desulfolithobacter dissulfuricans TaxID=2795293 RepID=A0A915U501_9BACT|nr:flagellar hook protein FlgE [Desulfolithobacter dissulfuricans]BCO08542.1 flagellar hook protein FlgE [Desulfolithobacter dissulfuricans]
MDNIFSQGTFEATSSDTDVAIEGEGFFLLRNPAEDTIYYSRAGAFRFDADGYLVNPEGFRVQGRQFDENNELVPGDPTDIQVINSGLVEANPTTYMVYNTNLDAASQTPSTTFDPADTTSYNYTSTGQVYDSLGETHLLTVYWRVDDPSTNTWHAYAEIPDAGYSEDLGTFAFDENGNLDATYLTYDRNGDGTNDTFAVTTAALDFGNGSNPSQTIDIVFDCTQYDSESVVIGQEQDGYATGNLTNVAINGEGIIVASYSNGKQVNVAQLVLGKFKNPNGLELAGANLYVANTDSGTPRVGLPGPELGNIFTNSLEQSNVDMGQEFVKMITIQRGFQANSKIISTVDELLGELVNLKR